MTSKTHIKVGSIVERELDSGDVIYEAILNAPLNQIRPGTALYVEAAIDQSTHAQNLRSLVARVDDLKGWVTSGNSVPVDHRFNFRHRWTRCLDKIMAAHAAALKIQTPPTVTIDNEMLRRIIDAYEDATGDRLPDGDGEDYNIARQIAKAVLGVE